MELDNHGVLSCFDGTYERMYIANQLDRDKDRIEVHTSLHDALDLVVTNGSALTPPSNVAERCARFFFLTLHPASGRA